MRLFIEYHKLRLIVILFKKSLSNIFPLFYNLIDVSFVAGDCITWGVPYNILFLQHLELFMLTSKYQIKSVSGDITNNNRNQHLVHQAVLTISLNTDFTTFFLS